MEIENKQEDILKQEKMVLNYKLCYMRNHIDKRKFPYVTSLKPEEKVRLTDSISKEYPEKKITKIISILEKRLFNENNKLF